MPLNYCQNRLQPFVLTILEIPNSGAYEERQKMVRDLHEDLAYIRDVVSELFKALGH